MNTQSLANSIYQQFKHLALSVFEGWVLTVKSLGLIIVCAALGFHYTLWIQQGLLGHLGELGKMTGRMGQMAIVFFFAGAALVYIRTQVYQRNTSFRNFLETLRSNPWRPMLSGMISLFSFSFYCATLIQVNDEFRRFYFQVLYGYIIIPVGFFTAVIMCLENCPFQLALRHSWNLTKRNPVAVLGFIIYLFLDVYFVVFLKQGMNRIVGQTLTDSFITMLSSFQLPAIFTYLYIHVMTKENSTQKLTPEQIVAQADNAAAAPEPTPVLVPVKRTPPRQ